MNIFLLQCKRGKDLTTTKISVRDINVLVTLSVRSLTIQRVGSENEIKTIFSKTELISAKCLRYENMHFGLVVYSGSMSGSMFNVVQ
jgi:hypothetical protein